MKKILFAAAALVAMASCATEDIVLSAAPEAIGFDSAFVDNSTRSVVDPSYTNAKLFTDFQVYGYVNGTPLFNTNNAGVRVAKDITNNTEGQTHTQWKYEGTQYWINGASYDFNAVAPATNGGWTKIDTTDATQTTLSFTNNGTTDLLYAYASAVGASSNNSPISFTFRHTLSKVKFSFENAYNGLNTSIRVKDIKILDPYKTGNVVLKATTDATPTEWSNQAVDANATNPFTLDFGMATDNQATAAKEAVEVNFVYGTTYESYNELLMIPGAGPYTDTNNGNKKCYTVQFTVELLVGTSEISEYTHTIYTSFVPEPGKSYDLKAVINHTNIDPSTEQEAIEFDVREIADWTGYNNDCITEVTSVATEAELRSAVAAGENVKLAANIELTAPLKYAPVTRTTTINEFIVDLNGYNISSTADVFEVAGGTLNIIGNGEVRAATTNGTPYCAVWAYGDAVVNISGGTYMIGYPTGDYNDLIYAKENAVINIYGGTFHNSGRENAFVLNVKDGSKADINVYGGSYEKFNPADNNSEGANTNFVAAGYKSVADGDYFKVVAE